MKDGAVFEPFVQLAQAAPGKNDDLLCLTVGERRVGKSSLAFNLGRAIQPNTFGTKFIVYSFDQFRYLVYNAPRGSYLQVDECVEGFWSSDGLTEAGKEATKLIAVMGERGLVGNFCVPDYANALSALKRSSRYLWEVPRRGVAVLWKRNKKRQFSKSSFPGYQRLGSEPYPNPESPGYPEHWAKEWVKYQEEKAANFVRRAQKQSQNGGYLEPDPMDIKALAEAIKPALVESLL